LGLKWQTKTAALYHQLQETLSWSGSAVGGSRRRCGHIGGALLVVRFMRSMLFQISAYDPKNFLAVVAVLAAVVFLACSIPAFRATRVDPVVATRNE
jgi:ABC-type lipoprotein release transport system permease subunit